MDFMQFISAFPTNKCTIASQVLVFSPVTRTPPANTSNTKIFSPFEVELFISVGKIIACFWHLPEKVVLFCILSSMILHVFRKVSS